MARKLTEEDITAKLSGTKFEYMGGFTNVNELCRFKCKKCGEVFNARPHDFFSRLRCPGCDNFSGRFKAFILDNKYRVLSENGSRVTVKHFCRKYLQHDEIRSSVWP